MVSILLLYGYPYCNEFHHRSIEQDFTWHTFFWGRTFSTYWSTKIKAKRTLFLWLESYHALSKISGKDIAIVSLIVASIHTMSKWPHLLSACINCIIYGRCLWACLFKIADCFVLVALKQMTTWRYFSWLQILHINLTACTQLDKNVLVSSRHLGP